MNEHNYAFLYNIRIMLFTLKLQDYISSFCFKPIVSSGGLKILLTQLILKYLAHISICRVS